MIFTYPNAHVTVGLHVQIVYCHLTNCALSFEPEFIDTHHFVLDEYNVIKIPTPPGGWGSSLDVNICIVILLAFKTRYVFDGLPESQTAVKEERKKQESQR